VKAPSTLILIQPSSAVSRPQSSGSEFETFFFGL
jgi:hypothetical protein